MITAILFILMMLVLVIPHEFGHFIVAKLCGVQVNEFSVGMGPLLYQKQRGETKYSIRLLPLGGYCAMEGENAEEGTVDNPRAFNNKKWWQKLSVLVAGVIMNIIVAALVLTISVSITGYPVNTIGELSPDMPAIEAGMEVGDKIIEIDGNEINSWADVTQAVSQYEKDTPVDITVLRDGTEKHFSVIPKYNEETQAYNIGFTAGNARNPAKCLAYGVAETVYLNNSMFRTIGTLIKKGVHRGDIAGPVGMVKLVDQTRSYGITSYMYLLALVSLNLALMNILPFPALDGGRIIFVFIRMITGNAISDDLEAKFHLVGMMLLLSLMIYITIGDISNLLG